MTDSQSFTQPSTANAIVARQVAFRWDQGQPPLTFPDFSLSKGEHLFVAGQSGAGKSTLLTLLTGLVLPHAGELSLLGQPLSAMKPGGRDRFRADHMGVIFQQFNLVPYLSTLDNVTLPCRLSAHRRRRAGESPADTARRLLERLNVPADHWQRKVTRLSVGQQQRVAAARALIGAPEIILADEPTSALDTGNRDQFLTCLLALAKESGSSIVFVSHDPELSQLFSHRINLGEVR